MKRYDYRVVVVSSLYLFAGFTASAAPKKLSDLFPGVANIDTSQVWSRAVGIPYAHFYACKGGLGPCDSPVPHFFDFSSSAGVDDSFDLMNHCTGYKGMLRYSKNRLISLTSTTVDCPNPDPDEVLAAHLVVCYEVAGGVKCNFATACFEGANAQGLCTKDYSSPSGAALTPFAKP